MLENVNKMQNKCKQNDSKPEKCKKKCEQKSQKNDSRAGKMTIFGFSRSAPGLATRAGRENDKKLRKNEIEPFLTLSHTSFGQNGV